MTGLRAEQKQSSKRPKPNGDGRVITKGIPTNDEKRKLGTGAHIKVIQLEVGYKCARVKTLKDKQA